MPSVEQSSTTIISFPKLSGRIDSRTRDNNVRIVLASLKTGMIMDKTRVDFSGPGIKISPRSLY